MTDIREVFASNLKRFRHARGWSQAALAEKTGTSTHYIGMLETMNKFPSSEMIHKLAAALIIEPTELFYREVSPETLLKNARRAALADLAEDVTRYMARFIAEELRETGD